MKHYLNLSFFIITLFSQSLLADILPSEFKNTHNIFTKDFQQLSPLSGWIWYKGGVLENLAELSGLKHKVSELITELFHRVDQANYKPSSSNTALAMYLSPKDLGKLAVRLLLMRHVEDKSLLQKELKRIIEAAIDSTIKDKKISLSSNDKKTLRRRSNKLPNLLVDALNMSDQDISVFKVLGALAAIKSANKNELLNYFLGIKEEIAGIKDESELFTAPDFLNDAAAQQKWLSDNFTDRDIPLGLRQLDDFELLAHSIFRTREPGFVDPYLTTFHQARLTTGKQFPDCGETSLFNLIRILFAAPDSLKIDVELLKRVIGSYEPLSAADKLIIFLSTKMAATADKDRLLDFSDLSDLRTNEARNGFAEVASNLPCNCLDYRVDTEHERCNISGERGYENMKNFIKELFNANGIEDLVKKTNKEMGKDNFAVIVNLDDREQFGTINIKSADRGNYSWHFAKSHFALLNNSSESLDRRFIEMVFNRPQPIKDLASVIPVSEENDKLSVLFSSDNLLYSSLLHLMRTDDEIDQYLASLSYSYLSNPESFEPKAKMLVASILKNALFAKDRMVSDDMKTRYFQLPVLSVLFDDRREPTLKSLRKNEKRKYKIAALCKFAPMDELISFLSTQKNEQFLDKEQNTPLHSALEFRCPTDVITAVFKDMTLKDMEQKNDKGETVLHLALSSNVDPDVFFMLLEKSGPEARNAKTNDGMDLFSQALQYKLGNMGSRASIIYKLLEDNILSDEIIVAAKGQMNPPIWYILSLKSELLPHILKLYFKRVPLSVIEQSLSATKSAVIHMAIKTNVPDEVLEWVIDNVSEVSIVAKNNRGHLPIISYFTEGKPRFDRALSKLLKRTIDSNALLEQKDAQLIFTFMLQGKKAPEPNLVELVSQLINKSVGNADNIVTNLISKPHLIDILNAQEKAVLLRFTNNLQLSDSVKAKLLELLGAS